MSTELRHNIQVAKSVAGFHKFENRILYASPEKNMIVIEHMPTQRNKAKKKLSNLKAGKSNEP
eukprot:Awhi_evm2s1991